MKLQDQVCSLELAKKLKELGVHQESIFRYDFSTRNGHSEIFLAHLGIPLQGYKDVEYFAAFTVAELGEMLPWDIDGNHLYEWKDCFGWWGCGYQKPENINNAVYMNCGTPKESLSAFIDKESQVNARAKMLIYLLENKLITL